jgi:uncharacterized protein (DUF1330 family)
MSIYMIIDLEVTDSEIFAKYVEKIPAMIEKFGGRYLVRGGKVTTVDGEWYPERIIVLEFPAMENVTKWLTSKEHMPLGDLRRRCTVSRAILVEGCQEDGNNA